ncbi:MAG: hypothetical protein [Wendovervirus sonii]|uniref:Virion structural protein n=1 Tax=phage Lak_Megaphage_Sonny TaxID=3109229 RepID=A0ABZ0Z6L9_9CAUD|nr:MAG: hypothetical protein [phage Lak_Megaphage_Sonny]
MSSNKNLFYDLYSKNNNIVNAGYTCSNAVDETDTSFDIMASTQGSIGAITDSNGSILSSINLNDIHAAGITQYNMETRILQPYSCCLLQGNEYGLARASYYFIIPEKIIKLFNYEKYVSCSFDIIYNNFAPYRFHIDIKADGENSFIDLINGELDNNNVNVSVSLQKIYDKGLNKYINYIVFLAQKEGYFYYINNLRLKPEFQNEDYPNSPFSKEVSGMKSIIYTLINQYQPVQLYTKPAAIYEVDCNLYNWLLANYQEIVDNIGKFKNCMKYLNMITDDTPETEINKLIDNANKYIKNTVYDEFFETYLYDISNMNKIYNIVESIGDMINELSDYFQDIYWLIEDRRLRVPLMKYPNGAFRGIVIVPEWPTNNGDEYQYSSLWINHIKSHVKLWLPTKQHQYMPKLFGVLSNATLIDEQRDYREHVEPHFAGAQSNQQMQGSIPDGWNDTLDTDYIDPYRPEHTVYEDTVYMGQNCYAHKHDIIGLFRYMQYVNDEHLWQKLGESYMIIGKDDDPQNSYRNLPESMIIYNPNDVPIRIKYLIFS